MKHPDLAPTRAVTRLDWDTARCNGTQHEQCAECLRRTAPVERRYQTYLAPPEFTDKCEYRIA
jgi:hypothetical protein